METLYVGCRLAGYGPVIGWLASAHLRQRLNLAELQRRFHLPPHRPLPPQRINQHTLQNHDDLLIHAPIASCGGGAADAAQTAAAGAVPQSLAEPCPAG